MSDFEKAECRAQGALDNFINTMREEMKTRDRSPEYENSFWLALEQAMHEKIC